MDRIADIAVAGLFAGVIASLVVNDIVAAIIIVASLYLLIRLSPYNMVERFWYSDMFNPTFETPPEPPRRPEIDWEYYFTYLNSITLSDTVVDHERFLLNITAFYEGVDTEGDKLYIPPTGEALYHSGLYEVPQS